MSGCHKVLLSFLLLLFQVEARHIETGEVVHKDTLGSSVAAVLVADFRATGSNELIVCSTEGEVSNRGTGCFSV